MFNRILSLGIARLVQQLTGACQGGPGHAETILRTHEQSKLVGLNLHVQAAKKSQAKYTCTKDSSQATLAHPSAYKLNVYTTARSFDI